MKEKYIEAIAAIGPKASDAEDDLTSILGGQSTTGVRAEALKALGRVAGYSESNWDLLARHLSQGDSLLQTAAKKALSSFAARHPEAVVKLTSLLRDEPEAALEILAQQDIEIRDDRLRGSLLRLARDTTQDANWRAGAIKALGNAHGQAEDTARELLDPSLRESSLAEARMSALIQLARRSDAVVALIVDNLRKRPDDRLISALGGLGPRAAPATPVLLSVLRQAEEMRGFALRTLAAIGPAARLAEPALAEILRSGSDVDRERAIEALKRLGITSSRTVAAILELVKKRGAGVKARVQVGEALRALDDRGIEPEVIDEVVDSLGEGDWVARKYVKIALIRLGPSAIEKVVPRLLDEVPRVRHDALEVIATNRTIPETHLNSLLRALRDTEPEVQRLAPRALARTGASGQGVADAIAEVLGSGSPEVRVEALKATRRLRLDSPNLRRAVAEEAQSKEAVVSQWAKKIQLSLDGSRAGPQS